MTKDNWIKAFDEKFSSEWWYGFGTTEDINKKGIDGIKSFISQVEKDAIERTRKECEDLHKNDSTPEEIRELMENVEKQAIEKTNKRWRLRVNEAIKQQYLEGKYPKTRERGLTTK